MVALIITFVFVLSTTTSVVAQEVSDPQDKGDTEATERVDTDEDASDEEGAEEKKKKDFPFVPIPVFITEPAIGYGLGAAIGYFHPRKGEEETAESISPAFTTGTPPGSTSDDEEKPPPVISGVAGAYTDKGSWGFGVGHMNNWKEDGIRYSGAIGYINVESTFYLFDRPADFNLQAWLTIQNLKFRLSRSDFFLGFKWLYIDADGKFKFGENLPDDRPGIGRVDSGLAIQAAWETLDNTMTPDEGQRFTMELWRYDEAIGGDYDYWKAKLELLSFHPFAKRFVLGLRLEFDGVDGKPPLWGYPWVTLRGIPALRYQNEKTGVLETELRWNIVDRWALVGFVGVAATRGDTRVYEDESGIVAGGIGGRWLFRPQDKLWVGLDVAQGPEDIYTYIQVGHAW